MSTNKTTTAHRVHCFLTKKDARYSDRFWDIFAELAERAEYKVDEHEAEDLNEDAINAATSEALDEGLIYTADQWAVLLYYCSDPTEANWGAAWESLWGLLYDYTDEYAEEIRRSAALNETPEEEGE